MTAEALLQGGKPGHQGGGESAADDAGRIVVLHTRVVAGRGGGPEKTILSSPAYFANTPYRPVAAYMHPRHSPGFEEIEAMAHRNRCELIGVPESGPIDPRSALRLLRICRELGVAVWHGHDYKSNLLGILLRRFHPMRLVTTLHGWCDLDLRTRLYFAVDRKCLPFFERVFCVSADLAEEARRCGVPERRISMLRNGVDSAHFRRTTVAHASALRDELGVPEGRRVIGALGRLAPVKSFDLAIDAFSRLSDGDPDSELWITGDGEERPALQRHAEQLGVAGRVRFLGHRDDVRPVLEACDVVVSSSLREATPNALLEAMAMEVVVVAPRVGGIPALVRDGETGILFRPGDVEGIASALGRLLADASARARMARAGRDLVRSEFSFDQRMRIEAEAYARLLDS